MKRVSLIIISVVVIAGIFFAATNMIPKKTVDDGIQRIPNSTLIKDYSPRMGPADAKVTVVEFLDPECETCAAIYPTMKGMMEEYKGQVQLVVRYMLFHGNSKLAALANEAAGKQGKYWEMQGLLFGRVNEWTHKPDPQTAVFEKFATELGLDLEKFKADMKDPQLSANIENDFKEGPTVGVRGTPTIFVNGRMLATLSYPGLQALIDEELGK